MGQSLLRLAVYPKFGRFDYLFIRKRQIHHTGDPPGHAGLRSSVIPVWARSASQRYGVDEDRTSHTHLLGCFLKSYCADSAADVRTSP